MDGPSVLIVVFVEIYLKYLQDKRKPPLDHCVSVARFDQCAYNVSKIWFCVYSLLFTTFHSKMHHSFLFTGSSTPIRHISLPSLIPNTDAYMTYEGSTTHPGCWESAVWIILNKPIYITKQEVVSSFIFFSFLTDFYDQCIFLSRGL